jgi:hypothetical protein
VNAEATRSVVAASLSMSGNRSNSSNSGRAASWSVALGGHDPPDRVQHRAPPSLGPPPPSDPDAQAGYGRQLLRLALASYQQMIGQTRMT